MQVIDITEYAYRLGWCTISNFGGQEFTFAIIVPIVINITQGATGSVIYLSTVKFCKFNNKGFLP